MIPPETSEFNQRIIEAVSAAPDPWSMPVESVRQARREGRGIFPLEHFHPAAETLEIKSNNLSVPIRIIRPESRPEAGVFMHIHGGGGMYGNADMQDQRLLQLANSTGLACVSVEYRLTPENPYPAGLDDCEAVAAWLVDGAANQLNTNFLSIGGESAGAHLSVCTLLRLRDRLGSMPFSAAVLIAGIYDMTFTPSASNFHEKLILTTRDIKRFTAALLQNGEDAKDPDVSPLYGLLEKMPPAHFSVGTKDALLDDTLFMAARWAQNQSDTELEVFPGACHVFQYFEELKQARTSRENVAKFLNRLTD